jgi:hypothetical protein
MLSAESRKHSIGFKFVNEMLNISYLSGWVRNPSKDGFLLQQTNSLAHAIFITVEPGTRIPKETTPVTVVCHAYGKKREDGKSVVELRAIDIKKPSSRSMPVELVWKSSLAKGATIDSFEPFKSDGTFKGMIAEQIDDSEGSEIADILRVLEATKGRLNTKLGENANVVMLAGFVEGAAIVRATHHGDKEQRAYISVMLRQHRDASLAIPIRVYEAPEMLAGVLKTIPVGYPISMVGHVQIKVIPNNENIEEIADSFLYIRTRNLSGATKGEEIKQEPDWWGEMAKRIAAERKDRQTKAVRPAAPAKSSAIVDASL